jgi:FAD/FMN-containing dehydrogenase
VVATRTLNRFIAVDWQTGVIRAEAGVTLQEILALAIPQGWFLPVTPGTQFVTLGGAIANDVHGKNHHRQGTFGRHVRRFGLYRSDRAALECSPAEHADLFKASIGGLGLTGFIAWSEIQLMPIRSSRMSVVNHRFGNLDEFFALSRELDARHEFCVSWIDCVAKGRNMGRGIYSAGDFTDDNILVAESAHKFSVPCVPPISPVNALTLRGFNLAYWHKASAQRQRSTIGYRAFFYPLDAILNWNRIYGPNGFQQYQCVIPERYEREAVRALLDAIATSGQGSFLAVLKRTGALPSPGLMSFPLAGTTLALDFPQTKNLQALFERLDRIVHEAGGRLYPAKDAHMSAADFQSSYPNWRQVEDLRDPIILSRFWSRVTLQSSCSGSRAEIQRD